MIKSIIKYGAKAVSRSRVMPKSGWSKAFGGAAKGTASRAGTVSSAFSNLLSKGRTFFSDLAGKFPKATSLFKTAATWIGLDMLVDGIFGDDDKSAANRDGDGSNNATARELNDRIAGVTAILDKYGISEMGSLLSSYRGANKVNSALVDRCAALFSRYATDTRVLAGNDIYDYNKYFATDIPIEEKATMILFLNNFIKVLCDGTNNEEFLLAIYRLACNDAMQQTYPTEALEDILRNDLYRDSSVRSAASAINYVYEKAKSEMITESRRDLFSNITSFDPFWTKAKLSEADPDIDAMHKLTSSVLSMTDLDLSWFQELTVGDGDDESMAVEYISDMSRISSRYASFIQRLVVQGDVSATPDF